MPHTKDSYWSHKKKGLCVECNDKVINRHIACQKHLLSKSVRTKRLQLKRKQNNCCISCGIKLHVEIDKGHVKCMNCREKLSIGVQFAFN